MTSNNIYDTLRKQMKGNQKRWEKIDKIVDQLKSLSEDELHKKTDLNSELLFLLVEQLRPAADYNNFDKNLDKFQKDVGSLVDNIMKTSARRK